MKAMARKKTNRVRDPVQRRKSQRVIHIVVHSLSAEFKPYRKYFFALRKALKYAVWASTALFAYHLYLVKRTDQPDLAKL